MVTYRCGCGFVCVNCWLDYSMSKRACRTITNYLNENHRQVRRVITERARTCISEQAMRDWICKKRIYFLSPFPTLTLTLALPPYPSSISPLAACPSSPPCQLNDCRSFLSCLSKSTRQLEYISLPSVVSSAMHTVIISVSAHRLCVWDVWWS